MARTLRGEIRWAEPKPARGHEQAGRRPVLIVSHNVFNARSGTVIAVAPTSQPQRAGFPLTLELAPATLPKPSWVKISQVRTLAVERIGARLGRAAPEEVTQVIEGLVEILGARLRVDHLVSDLLIRQTLTVQSMHGTARPATDAHGKTVHQAAASKRSRPLRDASAG